LKNARIERTSGVLPIAPLLLFLACTPESQPEPAPAAEPVTCSAPSVTGRLPAALFEASGLAAGLADPHVIWAVADGGAPILFALDSTGAVLGRIQIDGANNHDWESLASARCGAGNCLYIGDIGDNLRNRSTIAIYRFPEPKIASDGIVKAEKFEFTYPDGPHDAEALFLLPDEQVYIITKGRSEPVSVYRGSRSLASGPTDTLKLVQQLTASFVQLPEMVTGAGATPDGQWVVLRTYSRVQLYRVADGQLETRLPGGGIGLESLHEFQGEGVDLRADGTVLLLSEKGFDEGNPPISRMSCSLRF
jgi:hypothetical protein